MTKYIVKVLTNDGRVYDTADLTVARVPEPIEKEPFEPFNLFTNTATHKVPLDDYLEPDLGEDE